MSFAIQSNDGHHLGFLLLAGGPEEGDCVFRSLPKESEHFDSPESNYLFKLQQQGEFRWFRGKDGSFRVENSSTKTIAEIDGDHMKSSNHEYLVVQLESEK